MKLSFIHSHKLLGQLILLLFTVFEVSCQGQTSIPEVPKSTYKTENVIIVVIDGPRYSDTWGDTSHTYIPNMSRKMQPEGVFFNKFYNLGVTFTNPGHTAIITGVKQELENSGTEFPTSPSIFQLWLEKVQTDSSKAWIIASKGKLSVLTNTTDQVYHNRFRPSFNGGVNGNGRGYRADSLTVRTAYEILQTQRPNLVLINLLAPDVFGHLKDWPNYLKGITASDNYVWKLWNYIQQDSHYKDKTTLFITNDHGRHPDGHLDGFVSHGDGCESCRHISLLALGPDFRKGVTVTGVYEQVDIPTTIAKLMGFKIPNSQGRVINELFSPLKD